MCIQPHPPARRELRLVGEPPAVIHREGGLEMRGGQGVAHGHQPPVALDGLPGRGERLPGPVADRGPDRAVVAAVPRVPGRLDAAPVTEDSAPIEEAPASSGDQAQVN